MQPPRPPLAPGLDCPWRPITPTAPDAPRVHQVHYILDEMLLNGAVVDTNKANILEPVQLLEQVQG